MDQTLMVGSGLEVLKRVPEQFTPDHMSEACILFGLAILIGIFWYIVLKLIYLAMK